MLILLIGSNSVHSSDSGDRFDFKLSQHSRDKNKISKPALIQYTNPKDKKESYLLDAAIKAVYAPSGSSIETTGMIEVHKNTLIDKEQDTLSLGVMVGKYLIESGCTNIPGVVGVKVCKNNLFGDASVSYQKDNENEKKSVLAVFELSGTVADWYLNNVHAKSNFPVYWSPIFGLEYEDYITSNDSKEGSLGRLYGNIEIGVYPFFSELEGRLSFTFSHSYWSDFGKDEALKIEDDTHKLNKANISYQVTPSDSKVAVSLNLSWLDGENPRTKKADQQYTQFSIGVKF